MKKEKVIIDGKEEEIIVEIDEGTIENNDDIYKKLEDTIDISEIIDHE